MLREIEINQCGDARDVYAEEQGDGYMDVSWWP